MRDSVLDSFAVLACLCHEKGYALVLSLLERAVQARRAVLVTAPNWAEVRYRMEQKLGGDGWRNAKDTLLGFPIEVVSADRALAGGFDLPRGLWKDLQWQLARLGGPGKPG